jgi:hypothetical protein
LQVKQSHVISLLKLLSEKDIFVSGHRDNLFWRFGTHPTVSLPHEAEFLDAIASIVGEENLKDTRKLLADALERLEPVAPNFAYIAFHASCTLKSAHDVFIVAISPAYGATHRKNTVLFKK